MHSFNGYPLKNIFDFTIAGDQVCVTAVERLPTISYSEVFIFSGPLGSWVSLWNFETIRGSLMRPKRPRLASLARKVCILWFQFFDAFFQWIPF